MGDNNAEEVTLSSDEHKLLKKSKAKLEAHFGVKICIPEITKSNNSSSDEIVAIIYGRFISRSYVKTFLQRKMNKLAKQKETSPVQNNIPVITISESDSESIVPVKTQNTRKRKRRKRRVSQSKRDASYHPFFDYYVNQISTRGGNETHSQASSTATTSGSKEVSSSSAECLYTIDTRNINTVQTNGSIVILSNSLSNSTTTPNTTQDEMDDSIVILSEDINPVSNNLPSTSSQIDVPNKNSSSDADDSIIILSEKNSLPPAPDFIPLRTVSNYGKHRQNVKIPVPLPKTKRTLRPIVIDGSNVAREHGKSQNTFSSKGILLSIEYFEKRGHTDITAFVPTYRRHCRYGKVVTTNPEILEELSKTQKVVFTPSRRLNNGKFIACYDDRFVVELAHLNNGVILSNDNYRDVLVEDPKYKKTIEERLLMFCFVGDILMIPNDPLGRYGPDLDTFLTMQEPSAEVESTSTSEQVMRRRFWDEVLGKNRSSR